MGAWIFFLIFYNDNLELYHLYVTFTELIYRTSRELLSIFLFLFFAYRSRFQITFFILVINEYGIG